MSAPYTSVTLPDDTKVDVRLDVGGIAIAITGKGVSGRTILVPRSILLEALDVPDPLSVPPKEAS